MCFNEELKAKENYMNGLQGSDLAVTKSIHLSRAFLAKSNTAATMGDISSSSAYLGYAERAGAVIERASQRQARQFNESTASHEKVSMVAQRLIDDLGLKPVG